jgi:hypothetical protein
LYHTNSLSAAAQWGEATLTGVPAISVAILAIAAIGFRMLGGHMPYWRGAQIIVGCFMLFLAPVISVALLRVPHGEPESVAVPRPLAIMHGALSNAPPPAPYDPYAGAAVPSRGIDGSDLLPSQH